MPAAKNSRRRNKQVSAVALMRPKARYKSARAAWANVHEKTGVTSAEVTAAHTPKAYRWKLKTKSRPRARNPGKGLQKRVDQAVKLFKRFTGQDPEYLATQKINLPDAGMVIGSLDGVLYTTRRDGRQESYIHEFTGNSRPLLCASWDGQQLFLVGGSYNFTDEGIVDR